MKAKEVLKLLKISRQTLCRYTAIGRIHVTKNVNGYYNYNDDDVYALLNRSNERKSVIYARVSSTC